MEEPKVNFKLTSIQKFHLELQPDTKISKHDISIKKAFLCRFDETKTFGDFQVNVTITVEIEKKVVLLTRLLTIFDFKTINKQPMNVMPNLTEFVKAIQIATAHLRGILLIKSYDIKSDFLIPLESDESIYEEVKNYLTTMFS